MSSAPHTSRDDQNRPVAGLTQEVAVSRFVDAMLCAAESSTHGLVTGEPGSPVRSSWAEVHQSARRVAGGLAALRVGAGDRVGVLAGAPAEVAPIAQGSGCAARV